MNSKKVFWIVLLISVSLLFGYFIAPKFLDVYLESSYPKYDGKPVVGYQYLIEGKFAGYGDNHIYIKTKYGNDYIQTSKLIGIQGYKICSHNIGDDVKYIVIVDGNPYEIFGFVLKREIC